MRSTLYDTIKNTLAAANALDYVFHKEPKNPQRAPRTAGNPSNAYLLLRRRHQDSAG
jgi:hypothetical protein